MGHKYEQLSLEDRLRDCPTSRRWLFGPANRGSSGSLAIVDLSGAEAQQRQPRRLQTKLRSGTDAGAALGGVSPRTRRRPARALSSSVWPEGWSPEQIAGRLAREAGHRVISYESIYRFVYAQIARTQGLQLASLPAARQEQDGGSAGRQRRKLRKLHRRPYFAWPNGLPTPPIARPLATGRPT